MLQTAPLPQRPTRSTASLALYAALLISCWTFSTISIAAQPWICHTIDDSSDGADGTRLLDVNNDGRLDVATPWEQGDSIRVYLNPGPQLAARPWPRVEVGQVVDPEDAVLADMDGDGRLDVVSACEGRTRQLFVHWAPDQPQYRNSAAWKTTALNPTERPQAWMYAVPVQVDGQRNLDLFCGAKNDRAQIGWLQSPADPRRDPWLWHPLYKAGWTMSLAAVDVNQDGNVDLLATDRRGPTAGVLWLEHPGHLEIEGAANASVNPGAAKWRLHRIGPSPVEAMFLDTMRDARQRLTIAVAVKPAAIHVYRQRSADASATRDSRWEQQILAWPQNCGRPKAVAWGDVDQDGVQDLVLTAESAYDVPGVNWLRGLGGGRWETTPRPIASSSGVKYDRAELLDLDGDGDLDVLTSEEVDALGVIWYENPLR